jgi:hypothetical protein
MSKLLIIHIECRQMCRESDKIDQNSSCNLLTNMDQYGGIYVQIVLLTLRPSICYAQLHMYVYIDITIVYDMLSIV